MRTFRVRLQGPVRRILAMVAAWSLFSLPSLAVACAISCDSAACEASEGSCAGHEEKGSNRKEAPRSSSHCPGFHSAAAVSAVPRTFSGVGSEGLVQGYALLVTSGSPHRGP